MKYIKNKKHRDPRYFLHEQSEDDAAQEMRDRIAAHQGVKSTPARSGQEIANELGYGEEPSEETPSEAGGIPPEVALMETLWDLVGDFYRAGRSDVAFKLQKIAEMADEGHERLMPPGEGTPGFSLPEAPSTHSQQHQRLRKFRRP